MNFRERLTTIFDCDCQCDDCKKSRKEVQDRYDAKISAALNELHKRRNPEAKPEPLPNTLQEGYAMKVVAFSEVPFNSSFWEKCGDIWAPSHKLDAEHARYQTHDGLLYGEPYRPDPARLVKVAGLAAPNTLQEERQPVSRPRLDFWGWWRRDGNFYDPDTEDVPWYDKRKFLAEKAFDIGVAQSANYVADAEVHPWLIGFANGRTVSIAFEDGEPYLEVGMQQQLQIDIAAPHILGIREERSRDECIYNFCPHYGMGICVTTCKHPRLAAPKVVDSKEGRCQTILTLSNTQCRREEGHEGDHVGNFNDTSTKQSQAKVEEQDGEQELLYPKRYSVEFRDCSEPSAEGEHRWTREQRDGMKKFAVRLLAELAEAENKLLKAESVAPPSLPKQQIDFPKWCREFFEKHPALHHDAYIPDILKAFWGDHCRAAAPVALPTHQIVETTTQAAGYAALRCSCGRIFVGLGDEAISSSRASFEAHLPEKEGKSR